MDKDELITSGILKNKLLGNTEKQKKIIEVFEYHNNQMAKKVDIDFAPATLTRYETTLKHLKEFMKSFYFVDDRYLSQLNYKYVTDFEQYLKATKKIGHNTAIKYQRNFKMKKKRNIQNL